MTTSTGTTTRRGSALAVGGLLAAQFVAGLPVRPGYVLSDGFRVPGLPMPSLPVIGGDGGHRTKVSVIGAVSVSPTARRLGLYFVPEFETRPGVVRAITGPELRSLYTAVGL